MATEFLMPKLGLTMEEGTIIEWFADDGAPITAGEPLLRIETDKTETDVEAAATGRLHRVGQVGNTFACGERIGWFLDDGEDAPGAPAPAAVGDRRCSRCVGHSRSERRGSDREPRHRGRSHHGLAAHQATGRRAQHRPPLGPRHRAGRAHRRRRPRRCAQRSDAARRRRSALRAAASHHRIDAAGHGGRPQPGRSAGHRPRGRAGRPGRAAHHQRRSRTSCPKPDRPRLDDARIGRARPDAAPPVAGTDAHHPAQRDPGHDRQTDARVAAPDGSAHALHGRRPRCGRRRPRASQGIGSSAELHRLRDRGGCEGARAASARQLPDHRRRCCTPARGARRHGGRPRRRADRACDPRTRLRWISSHCRSSRRGWPQRPAPERSSSPIWRVARSRSARSACTASTGSPR